jgi:hypothetical protein
VASVNNWKRGNGRRRPKTKRERHRSCWDERKRSPRLRSAGHQAMGGVSTGVGSSPSGSSAIRGESGASLTRMVMAEGSGSSGCREPTQSWAQVSDSCRPQSLQSWCAARAATVSTEDEMPCPPVCGLVATLAEASSRASTRAVMIRSRLVIVGAKPMRNAKPRKRGELSQVALRSTRRGRNPALTKESQDGMIRSSRLRYAPPKPAPTAVCPVRRTGELRARRLGSRRSRRPSTRPSFQYDLLGANASSYGALGYHAHPPAHHR